MLIVSFICVTCVLAFPAVCLLFSSKSFCFSKCRVLIYGFSSRAFCPCANIPNYFHLPCSPFVSHFFPKCELFGCKVLSCLVSKCFEFHFFAALSQGFSVRPLLWMNAVSSWIDATEQTVFEVDRTALRALFARGLWNPAPHFPKHNTISPIVSAFISNSLEALLTRPSLAALIVVVLKCDAAPGFPLSASKADTFERASQWHLQV